MRCHCLLGVSIPRLHFLPIHLQWWHTGEVQVGLPISEKIVSLNIHKKNLKQILKSVKSNFHFIIWVECYWTQFLRAWFFSPTICMSMIAVSTWFSTCTVISYFPEWLRSALRMNMILSQSVLRMLTWDGSMGLPSFSQVTFGLGFPCRDYTEQCEFLAQWIYCEYKLMRNSYYQKWNHKIYCLSNSASICLLQMPGYTDLRRFYRGEIADGD